MSNRRAIPFPVVFELEEEPGRIAVVYADIEMRCFSSEEAPEVATWQMPGERVYRYRLADGVLWTPVVSWAQTWATTLEATRHPGGIGIQPVLKSSGALHAPDVYLRMTSPMRSSPPLIVNGEGIGPGHPWWERAMRIAPEADDRLCAIDGQIWMRSFGPVIQTRWRGAGKRVKFEFDHGRAITQVIQRSPLTFSAFDPPKIVDALLRRFDAIEIKGDWPIVLGDIPHDDQLDRLSGERAVWHFLHEASTMPPSSVSVEALDLVGDAREALSSRWPGQTLSFGCEESMQVATHLYGRTAPAADDLIPIVERMIDVGPTLVEGGVVQGWQVVLDRLNGALSQEDLASMVGLV